MLNRQTEGPPDKAKHLGGSKWVTLKTTGSKQCKGSAIYNFIVKLRKSASHGHESADTNSEQHGDHVKADACP